MGYWTDPVGSKKGKEKKPKKLPKIPKRQDPYARRTEDIKYTARVEGMRSAPGGSTPSRQVPKVDPYKNRLMKAAERGDESAKQRLAHMWKHGL